MLDLSIENNNILFWLYLPVHAISFFIMPSKETIKHVLINETTVELEKNPNNVNLKYILDDIKKRK